ncbi:MAG: hypothetical protein AABZ30_13740 [Myxococcota bacterium]
MRGLLAAGLACASCGTAQGHPPVARIDVLPEYVPAGDDFHTTVVLDGTRSCDELDAPETCLRGDAGTRVPEGLRFAWTVAADDARIDGEMTDARIDARVSGERPIEVTLTVTDGEDLSATAAATIGITLPADGVE